MADKRLSLEVVMAAVDRLTGPLKAITGGSQRMAESMKAARQAVKDLEEQQSKLDKFTKARDAAHAARTTHNEKKALLDKLKGKQEELRDAQHEARAQAQAARDNYKAISQLHAKDDRAVGINHKLITAREQVEKLEAAYSRAQSSVRKNERDIKDLGVAVEQTSKSKKNWYEAMLRTRTALRETGADIHKLTAFQDQLKAKTEEATAAAEKQGKAMQRMHAAQAQAAKTKELAGKLAGTGATMAVAGAAISAPVAKTVADYSKFEDAMLGVARQVDGARDGNGKLTKTYYDMAQEIKRLSTTIPLATVEIAKIVEAGARMGIQGKENLIEFAKTTAMTAAAFDLPVDQIGEQMGKLAQLYKIPIPAISTLGDTINWLDDNALSKGGDIIDVMQRIAGTASGVNMVAKEAAALGSTFLSLGARAEVAATASNAMIRELSIATMQPKRFQEGIKALGLSAQGLQIGMPKDATGTILNVLDKLKALPSDKRLEVATRIFGKEYGDDAAKLAENLDEYRRQLKLVNDEKAKGSMKREGDARNDTLSAGGQIVKNKFFNLTSAIGETQRETVMKVSQSIGDLLDRITAFVERNPGFVGAVVKIATVIATLLAVFGGVALAVAAVLGPFAMARMAMTTLSICGVTLKGVMGTIWAVIKIVGKAMLWVGRLLLGTLWGALKIAGTAMLWVGRLLMGTVWGALKIVGTAVLWVGRLFLANPILALVALIAAAAIWVWRNWDTLGPKFWAIWESIKTGAVAAWDAIVNYVVGACYQMLRYFSPVIMWFKDKWDEIKGAFTAAWDYCTTYLAGLPDKFTTIGGQVIDGLMTGFKTRWETAKTWLGEMGNQIAQTVRDALGIKSPSRVFAEIGGHVMGGLTMGLDGGEDGPLSRIKTLTDKITAAGAGIALGMGAAGAAAAPITIDTRPPITASAMSASQQAAAAPNITITVNAAPGMDEAALARLVAAEIEKATRQKQVASRSRLTDTD